MDGRIRNRTRDHLVLRTARRWRRNAGEVLRREGFRRLLVRAGVVARGIVYRYVVVVALDLTLARPDVSSDLQVQIRLLRPEDVAAYARFRGRPVDAVPALRRLDEGDLCVAVWLEDEIVAAAWYAFGKAWVDEIGRSLRLAADEVYAYDSYTAESRRRHNLAALRGIWAAAYLRENGYRRIVGWISPQNRPAFGPARKVGYETLGTVGFLRLGPWRRDFVRPEGGRRRWVARGQPIEAMRDFAASAGRRAHAADAPTHRRAT